MRRGIVAFVTVIAALGAVSLGTEVSAHKTAVSPYTFHRDVVPIFEARCGQCHQAGSPSGLDLFRYDTARGASWRVRQMLARNHMPPWFAEGAFKAPAPLTAQELNVLMTWATGGAPEGKPQPRTMADLGGSWPLGNPDQIVAMPTTFTFTTDQGDLVHEAVLPARIGGRLIRAVDLLPGTRALVRSAEIIARSRASDVVLGVWQPGEFPAPLSIDAAVKAPANASLVVRIRYRRHYGDPDSDRSQVGLYFAPTKTAVLRTWELNALHVSQTFMVPRQMRVVALRPVSGPSGTIARLSVIEADGSRRDFARLQLQNDWRRRYVFATPMTLAARSRLEISITPSDSRLWASLTDERIDADSRVHVAIDFVP